MTETPYLIAHSVRGQPAFDIAIQMEMEDEVWWIIPTSGHRAYPYWNMELSKAMNGGIYVPGLAHVLGTMPPNWPDHYWAKGQTSDLDIPTNEGSALLAGLGLLKPKEPIKRRV